MEKYQELFNDLIDLTEVETSLSDLKKKLNVSNETIMGLIALLKNKGINIVVARKDDDIYFLNQGDNDYKRDYSYSFKTDGNNKKKFLVISDLRLGSIFSQISILNELYLYAYDMGIRDVIVVGNITEGLYKISDNMINTLVASSTNEQINYVVNVFPYIEGMKTYFITGKKDKSHLINNKVDIGKKISMCRDDLIYIGNGRCNINIDNINIFAVSRSQIKTYTQSYRTQKMVDAMRSEDKPDFILYGGLLQCEKFVYRDVKILTIPSVCASTWEMEEKEYSNTIGGIILELESDKNGFLKNYSVCDNIYYQTIDNDYMKARILKRR